MKYGSNCLYLIVFSFFLVNANATVNKAGHTLQAAESLSGQIRIPFIRRPGSGDNTFHATALNGRVSVDGGVLKYRLPSGADEPVVAFEERFVTGNQPGARGINPARVTVNYLLGNRESGWQRNLKTFNAIAMDGVWNGVDVRLELNGGHIEKIFSVRPGASIDQIRLQTARIGQLRINDEHELVVSGAPSSDVSFSAPIAYQERQGRRVPVEVAYRLYSDDTYGFDVGPHDPSLPLIIDPVLQSTYLGGNPDDDAPGWGSDHLGAILVHPVSGDVYAVGGTDSLDLGDTTGIAPSEMGSGDDNNAILARFSHSLRTLKQLTVFGGSDAEYATSMAINPDNADIYVAGHTFSTDLPNTEDGAQSDFGGAGPSYGDAFVALFDADISVLKQTTYFGGSTGERFVRVMRHPDNGDIYLTADTGSNNLLGTTGGAQPSYTDEGDTFIARLKPSLKEIVQATYYGAADNGEMVNSITASPITGDIYIAGQPYSASSNSLPGVSGGYDEDGADGIFVTRFNEALTAIVQATYLGGVQVDSPAVVVHPQNGDVYVSAHAWGAGLPGDSDFQGGGTDIYVARFNAGLTDLVDDHGQYLGGDGSDDYSSIIVHPLNNDIYVGAQTNSSNVQGIAGGAVESPLGSFISRLDIDLNIVQSTYYPRDIYSLTAAPVSGDVYISGAAYENAPLPAITGASQDTIANYQDGFAARITPGLEAGDITPNSIGFELVKDADPNVWVTSDQIPVTGIDSAVLISIEAGEYSIDGGPFTSDEGVISPGQTVTVRVLSADELGEWTRATLIVGDHETIFAVSTREPAEDDDSDTSSSTGGGGGGGGPINVWLMLIGLTWLFKSTRNEPIPRNRG